MVRKKWKKILGKTGKLGKGFLVGFSGFRVPARFFRTVVMARRGGRRDRDNSGIPD
jgi:hypothetical protein